MSPWQTFCVTRYFGGWNTLALQQTSQLDDWSAVQIRLETQRYVASRVSRLDGFQTDLERVHAHCVRKYIVRIWWSYTPYTGLNRV